MVIEGSATIHMINIIYSLLIVLFIFSSQFYYAQNCPQNCCSLSQNIKRVFTLGASESDAGTTKELAQSAFSVYPQAVPFISGRDTVNPGLTYAGYLAQEFCGYPGPDLERNAKVVPQPGQTVPYTNQVIVGGPNYAQSGASVGRDIPFNPDSAYTPAPETVQLQRLITQRPNLQNTLIPTGLGWVNEISFYTLDILEEQGFKDAFDDVENIANTMTSIVNTLTSRGAENVILFKVDNPLVFPGDDPAALFDYKQITSLIYKRYQETLINNLQSNQKAFFFDLEKMLAAIIENPTRFGFLDTNLTSNVAVIHRTQPIPIPVESGGGYLIEGFNIENSSQYLYSDFAIHLTPAGQKIMSDTLFNLVKAPENAASIPVITLLSARQRLENFESHIENIVLLKCKRMTDINIYTHYTYENTEIYPCITNQLRPGFNNESNGAVIGLDWLATPHITLGAAGNFIKGDTCFSQHTGGFANKLNMGLLYGIYELPCNFYASLIGGIGNISIDQFCRKAFVGFNKTPLRAYANTCGTYRAAKASVGCHFDYNCFLNNISLGLAHEKTLIKNFSERGDFIALNFDTLCYDPLKLSLAWDIYYIDLFEAFDPYFRIALEHDLKKTPLLVNYSMIKKHFTSACLKRPARTYAHINTGFNYYLGQECYVNLSANIHAGQEDIKSWSLYTGLNYQF